MTLRLNRLELLKAEAERLVDEKYALILREEFGPVGMLHLVKRYQAIAGMVPDRDAVLARVAEQDARLLDIDDERRAEKAKIRACVSIDELGAYSSSVGP